MFSTRTSLILKKLDYRRSGFASDAAINKRWTARLASKAKVSQALVEAAFKGESLNATSGGKPVFPSSDMGKLKNYLLTKINNKDIDAAGEETLNKVASFLVEQAGNRISAPATRFVPRSRTGSSGQPSTIAPTAQALSAPTSARTSLKPAASDSSTSAFHASLVSAGKKLNEASELAKQGAALPPGRARAQLSRQAASLCRAAHREVAEAHRKNPTGGKQDLAHKIKRRANELLMSLH